MPKRAYNKDEQGKITVRELLDSPVVPPNGQRKQNNRRAEKGGEEDSWQACAQHLGHNADDSARYCVEDEVLTHLNISSLYCEFLELPEQLYELFYRQFGPVKY